MKYILLLGIAVLGIGLILLYTVTVSPTTMINEIPPASSPEVPPPGPKSYQAFTRVIVQLGETVITPEGVHIQFDKIVDDSRCPNGVNCFWPGEATIEAYITAPYADGRRVKAAPATLTIPGAARFAEPSTANTVSSDQWSVVFYGLEPYPEANQTNDSPTTMQAWFAIMPVTAATNPE
ncbi:MAG: hypothetical protein WD972_03050 [Candidatus Andersenbacteria bacterium]